MRPSLASMTILVRPAAEDYVADFADYVAEIADDEDVLVVRAHQLDEALTRLGAADSSRGEHRYAPGKWSLSEVVGHLSDTERVFASRALWIARGEPTPLPPYDDQRWVSQTGAEHRALADMVEEWGHVRRATLALFRHLTSEAWRRRGTAGDGPITVRALAYVIAGHTRHHLRVVEARYLR
jgi:hypothetical protein